MADGFATLAAAIAVAMFWIVMRSRRARRTGTESPGQARVRRGAGQALLGLQGFVEPSVESIVEAQNVEQKEEEDDDGLGDGEAEIASNLALALGRSPVDVEEVRRHLTAAARAGLDWQVLYDRAVADELRECPYRAPAIPPARRVRPRE